jgi:hypothetical protein
MCGRGGGHFTHSVEIGRHINCCELLLKCIMRNNADCCEQDVEHSEQRYLHKYVLFLCNVHTLSFVQLITRRKINYWKQAAKFSRSQSEILIYRFALVHRTFVQTFYSPALAFLSLIHGVLVCFDRKGNRLWHRCYALT